MSEISLKDIWDLRGELHYAVESREYAKIIDVKNKFNKMMQLADPQNMLFYNFHNKLTSPDSVRTTVNLNRLLILENIQAYEKKYIQGLGYSTKLQKSYHKISDCYAIFVWTLRALYDKFMAFDPTSATKEQTKQNMILGEAIIDKIKLARLSAIHEWETEEIKPIEGQIVKSYIERYQNSDIILPHSILYEEFVDYK